MADSFISELSKAVGNQLFEEACLLHGVPEEAKKMEQNLKKIEAVLKDAEQREIENDVKIWLSDLKNVAYDIENLLDDWSIAEPHMQDESGTSQQGRKSKAKVLFPFISAPCFWSKQLKTRHHIAHDIKAINERLGEIDEKKNRFNFPTSNIRISEGPKLEATSAYGNFTIVRSQEEVMTKVIEKLVHGDSKVNVANGNHIPIISLVGMGGIGKTTLARLVYNDKKVEDFFSKTIWVCVSNTFNEMNVARAIAGGLGLEVRNDSTPHLVFSRIDASIRGLKFLLVLDDVWEESEGKWSAILSCLGRGVLGSRILMTTRNLDISEKMGADKVFVEELSTTDAWLLFSYYAFPGNSDHHGIVKDIAEKLAKKCHGLPLALEVLGRHMSTKTTRSEWDDVFANKLWETKFEEKVFNVLAFSYLELPSEAKRCFVFCSIFPKDTVMKKNELIRLWMAQGYLQERRADQMEVLGEVCFESLLRRSFFRVSEASTHEFADIRVTMHDIIHDFARYISNGEVAILDPSLEMHECDVTSAKLRHLALVGEIRKSNNPFSNFDHKVLRTLFLSAESVSALQKLCSKKSYMRALDIKISHELETRDDDFKDIGKLIHLRYVRLSLSGLVVLSKEICGLPYLQTLDLRSCGDLQTLPKEIGRLRSLRHLLFHRYVVYSLPRGIGKLSSLRTLSCFICSSHANKDYSCLEDLRHLNSLQGQLPLTNLNNVANVDEATRAELHKKTQVREIILEFGDGDASLQSKVLEALQPSKQNMEILKIKNYTGRRCPRWIGQMRHLKKIELSIVSIEVLPELGMLFFLEKLFVELAEKVKHVGAEFFGIVEQDKVFFPKLTKLVFNDMDRWEHWKGPNDVTRSGVTIMPSLRCLIARGCRALRTLPRFLECVPLESLEVDSDHLPPVEQADAYNPIRWRIGDILLPQTLKEINAPFFKLKEWKALVQPKEISGEAVQHKHLNFTSLQIGEPYSSRITTVPRQIIDLTNLREIRLINLNNESLPPLGSLPFLEELTIYHADMVGKVGDEFLGISTTAFIVFPRLKTLTFKSMRAWREWEDPVHGGNIPAIMPSLCHLQIFDCVKLKSLPHFFESVPLQMLDIAATEEGDMLKIRNTTADEPSACETVKAGANTLAQLDVPEITLWDVWNDWVLDWAKYCKGLRKLDLFRCGVASLAALEQLPSLEVLNIYWWHGIRHIGKELLQISSLKQLRLFDMLELEEWEDPPPPQLETSKESGELSRQYCNNNSSAIINLMPSLCILSIHRCPKLKALPSCLRSVPLESLTIISCDALKTWWVNEARHDWCNWKSTIPRFTYREVELED